LTDTPIPDDIIAGKPVSSAARAAGVKNYVVFVFREDKQQAGAFGFLGQWIVGRRTIGEATLSTEGPQENFGDKFQHRVAFNAVVKPRAK
jgi:hypothetical protein